MTDKPDNQPAFPVQHAASWQWHGMTLRDWFAGQALAGHLACPLEGALPAGGHDEWLKGLASNCFKAADAMIAARGDK